MIHTSEDYATDNKRLCHGQQKTLFADSKRLWYIHEQTVIHTTVNYDTDNSTLYYIKQKTMMYTTLKYDTDNKRLWYRQQ